jgi:hypothetical protein
MQPQSNQLEPHYDQDDMDDDISSRTSGPSAEESPVRNLNNEEG